jgi:hypothetical protein
LFAFSLLTTGCSERIESSYSSLSEASNNSAIARGWVPDSLSGDVLEIKEKHDLDTNEVWGTFRFPKGRNPLDQSMVESMSPDVISKLTFRVRGVGFWPPSLYPPIQANRASSEGFEFLADPKQHFIFAINREADLGFYWSVKNELP